MFNIVKRRDFMLAGNVPTREEAEKARDDYGSEYVVVGPVDPPRQNPLSDIPRLVT